MTNQVQLFEEKKLRKRDTLLGDYIGTNCPQVVMTTQISTPSNSKGIETKLRTGRRLVTLVRTRCTRYYAARCRKILGRNQKLQRYCSFDFPTRRRNDGKSTPTWVARISPSC